MWKERQTKWRINEIAREEKKKEAKVWVGYNRMSDRRTKGERREKRREKEKEGIGGGIWVKGREDDSEGRGVKGKREKERDGRGRERPGREVRGDRSQEREREKRGGEGERRMVRIAFWNVGIRNKNNPE